MTRCLHMRAEKGRADLQRAVLCLQRMLLVLKLPKEHGCIPSVTQYVGHAQGPFTRERHIEVFAKVTQQAT